MVFLNPTVYASLPPDGVAADAPTIRKQAPKAYAYAKSLKTATPYQDKEGSGTQLNHLQLLPFFLSLDGVANYLQQYGQKDGRVDVENFAAYVNRLNQGAARFAAQQDRDGNGTINALEMAHSLNLMSDTMAEQFIERMTGDSKGTLSYEQFAKLTQTIDQGIDGLSFPSINPKDGVLSLFEVLWTWLRAAVTPGVFYQWLNQSADKTDVDFEALRQQRATSPPPDAGSAEHFQADA